MTTGKRIALVQAADLWGDPNDSAGVQAAFVAGADSFIRGTSAHVMVVLPNARLTRPVAETLPPDVRVITSTEAREWVDASFDEVIVSVAGASRAVVANIDHRLRSFGFVCAGHGWGAAGATRRFVRPRSPVERARALVSESRRQFGFRVVGVRDRLLTPSPWRAMRRRLHVRFSRELDPADEIDERAGTKLPQMPVLNVYDLLPARHGVDLTPWSIDLDREQHPLDVARHCHSMHGVWPLSFSYPSEPLAVRAVPDELVAPIVPGLPYSFDDAREYLETYQRAYLGLTHRKAGWDCFRHVEILAAGALPLMPDARDIPGFSMIHYPKRAMAALAEDVRAFGSPPDDATRQAFRRWFSEHLTTAAMARYVLRAAGLEDASRVLFVDEKLGGFADYQSVLTLIGLKQLFGSSCHVMYETDYIYADTQMPVARLYGRGFGYTRVLPGDSRSATERGSRVDLDSFDVLVVGGVSRNRNVAMTLLKQFPAQRTILIHGDDEPPPPEEVHGYRSSGAHTFIRSIHAPARPSRAWLR